MYAKSTEICYVLSRFTQIAIEKPKSVAPLMNLRSGMSHSLSHSFFWKWNSKVTQSVALEAVYDQWKMNIFYLVTTHELRHNSQSALVVRITV